MEEPQRLRLPTSGYTVLAKILHAYQLSNKAAAGLDEIAQKASLHRTQVAANHGFLASLGLIEGGKKKKLTEPGMALATAIGNELPQETASQWQKAISGALAVKPILDMIKVQKSVAADELPRHIANALQLTYMGVNKTGINCLIEIMRASGLLVEVDSRLSLASGGATVTNIHAGSTVGQPRQVAHIVVDDPARKTHVALTPYVPEFHVNIQVHISADASPEQVDNVFASMAKHFRVAIPPANGE